MKFYCNDCCTFMDDPVRHDESDPYGTGDSWYVLQTYHCPRCNSEDIDEKVTCECCGDALPLEDYNDCAECILSDMSADEKIYEPIDYKKAKEFLNENG